jgi:hypothetical protein
LSVLLYLFLAEPFQSLLRILEHTQIYFNALILVMNPENFVYGIQNGQVEPDPDPTGPENPEKPGQDGEDSPESSQISG